MRRIVGVPRRNNAKLSPRQSPNSNARPSTNKCAIQLMNKTAKLSLIQSMSSNATLSTNNNAALSMNKFATLSTSRSVTPFRNRNVIQDLKGFVNLLSQVMEAVQVDLEDQDPEALEVDMELPLRLSAEMFPS